MFVRTFRSLFLGGKKKPIVNAKKAPWPRKRLQLALELLEERIQPSTIFTQWAFPAAVGPSDNSPTPTLGTGTAITLGMTNSFNGGNTAADDILSSPGVANPAFSEQTWRIRGSGHNGWATHAAGAAQYTQGAELDASTVGQSNIHFSFDWYSTNQGIRDLQVQYNTDVTNPATWTNIGSTYIAVPNDFYSGFAKNITVDFSSITAANNDANFGVRLVSAYDSTGNVPNDYAGATLDANNHTIIYNNSSGNWRFDNMTFSSEVTTNSVVTATPASPQAAGTSVTFTYTITPVSGSNPTGTVQFYDGFTPLGTPQTVTAGSGNTGVATFTTSALAIGTHAITAQYNLNAGDNFAGDRASSSFTISGITTSGVVTATPASPQQAGTNVTFTDTITPSSGSANATGTVKFFDGTLQIGTTQTVAAGAGNTGVASISISTLTSGSHNITAHYIPTGNFVGDASPAIGYTIISGTPGAFTPGNLVILQAGDGVTAYNAQAPLFLNEITTTGASVQQVSIPATGGVGNANNQPITLDLSAAAGNGQLTRSYDGSALTFNGIDSTINNGGLTPPATPSGQDDRVVAVLTGNPTVASNLDTTTHGPFYVGDDNRGSVAESPTGPIYTAGHPNQAGGAVSQGVHEFDTEGPSIGTQVSATTNIRGINIGFDNRMYFSTAGGLGGATALNTAGIFTEAQALPTAANGTPANDIQVVPALFSASKLGGLFLADMNGDGIVDNGDRLYFLDDGTVGGAGTGGVYVATWNDAITANPWNTPNNAAAVAAGLVNHWSVPVRLGDAPVQPGSGNVGQLRGVTGTVISPTEVDLYTTAFDNAGNDSSYVQQWKDTNSGVAIASASESGTTVTITTLTPNAFTEGQVVEVDGVGANNGAASLSTSYNGAWTIHVVDSTHFTYTDTNSGASNLATVTNQGAADVTVNATTVQVLAAGSETVGSKTFGEIGLRGVAFAPVAATSVTLAQSPANPLTPGTAVTLTATLSNAQVASLSGQVAFIDQNTHTVLGFGTISGNQAVFTTTLVGNHFVSAYFSGGGPLALASANSNTLQVIEAGATASTTSVVSNLVAAAIGKQVNLTATVTAGATGTVSFFNGSVALVNLLGTASLSGTTATLTAAFGTVGAQNIIAVYNGDNTYASSQGTTTVNVAANATAAIASSANNVAVGSVQTYTATINGNATLGTPAGTVRFTIVSATTNSSGAPLVNVTSSAITLIAGPNNTATAVWTGPALSAPGSYFVTISYTTTGATNPYSNFAVSTTSATSGVALIETAKQAFTPGNLVAVQRGDGTVNLGSAAYPVFLDEYTPSGTLVQAIALPNVDAGSQHALFLSGQNGAEGLLNRSANGYFLTLSGYDLPVGRTFITSSFPYQFPRTIAEINGAASVDTSTAIGVVNGTGVPASITAASESGTTVTITTSAAHNFKVGQNVIIAGITPSGYDGSVIITGVTATTFTYTAAASLGAATLSSATATPAAVPYNPLDVVSNDGKEFWLASSLPTGDTIDSGIEFVSGLGATSAVQIGSAGGSAAAISIAGGQLYVTKGSGNIQAVGAGLPTTPGQNLTSLPNLATAYANAFPNNQNPTQVLLLNTNDGTSNSPNVAYIADQANGLLKFWLNTAGVSTLTESASGLGTTVTVTTTAPNTLVSGQSVQISGASVAGYNGTFTITVIDSQTFTYTATTSGLAAATGGVASQWEYGGPGGIFGQKLVFAGGATGVVGFVVNPGASAQVQLYVTGVNVVQQNPNQIDAFLDTHGGAVGSGSNGVDQGFPSGNFTNLGFVGGASPAGSPNGNENFAGLAFVPGFVTSTTLSDTGEVASNTFTATVTSLGGNVPTGVVIFSVDGTVVGQSSLNGSGVATFLDGTFPTTGSHVITAAYQGDVKDGTSTGTLTQGPSAITSGDLIVTRVGTGSGALAGTGTATFIDEFTTTTASQSSPVQSIALPTTGGSAFTEKGTSTTEGYVTDASDGRTASLVGYNVAAGTSTSFTNSLVGVVNPNGSIESSTQVPSSDTGGSVRAVASADGLGFWVATSNFVRYVPFGNSPLTGSTQVSNYFPSPTVAEIGNGQLYVTGGAGAQSNGVPAIDGPASIGMGLPDIGGQTGAVLGGFPTVSGVNGFPTSNQFAISPDGQTIFVADSRTNAGGGILEFFQVSPGQWTNVNLGGAGFPIGAIGADSGLRGLSVDWSNPNAPIIYATTSAASANRIVKITGGTTDGNTPSYVVTTLATAPANEAFRGVALAPKAAGATASTTTLAVSNSPATYGSGVTLTATVSAGATGWVSFRQNGVEIGAAAVNTSTHTATFTTAGNLGGGTYTNIVAVYTGDATFAASTSSPPQSATINKASTNTSLAAAFTSIATGIADQLTATITGIPQGTAPTGTVTFWDGPVGTGTNLGTATVSQVIVAQGGNPVITFVATLSATFTTTGAHTVSAVYSGDNNFTTSTGTQTVNVVQGSSVVVTTNKPLANASGDSVTLTATVSGAAGTATGTVQFYDNLLAIGGPVTLSGGAASITLSTSLLQSGTNLTPGLHSITAVYSGDATYFTSKDVYEQAVKAQAFGAGDQVVERAGDGVTPLIVASGPNAGTASLGASIYLDEYSAAGTLIQSIILPSADGNADSSGDQTTIHAIVSDGQQSATGQLTRSADGGYLFLTGYDSSQDPSNLGAGPQLHTSTTTPRAVARVDANGTVQTIGFTGVQTGGNIDGVYSPDGNKFYVSGFNGVSYFSSFTPSAALQSATATIVSAGVTVTALENDGGNLALVNSATTNANPVQQYTGFPTATTTATSLPGVTGTTAVAGGQATQFTIDAYFTHLNGTGAPAGINTMYLTDDGPSFAHGAITKWKFDGTTWTVVDHITAGTGNLAPSFYWLNGLTDGSGNVTLYVTYANGGNANTGPGYLFSLSDTNGYGAPIGTGGAHSDSLTELAAVGGADLTGFSTTNQEIIHGVASIPLAATTTTLVDNGPNPSTTGQNVSFTVTVAGGASISGETVNIEDADAGNAIVATPTLTGGTATFNISSLAVGTHHLFAVYTSDGSHAGSQSAQVSQQVNNALINTTTTLTDNGPNPSIFGQAVSFTTTVTPASGSAVTDGETVNIEDASNGNAIVASPTLTGGTVTFNITNLSIGSHLLFAVYAGDSTHNGSQSANISPAQVVNAIPTTVVVTSDNSNPNASGATVNFTATVASGSGTPTGSVQFFDNGLAVGSQVSLNGSGVATLTETTAALQAAGKLTPGIHSITAIYTPTGNFAASKGTLNQKVQANAFGAGDELVYRVGDGSAAWNIITGNSVFVDEFTAAGTAVQTIALPTVDGGVYRALVQQGQQSSTGQLSLSGDGQYVFLTGYDATPGTGDVRSATTLRTIARIKYDGTVDTEAISDIASGTSNINGVYSPDGSQVYVAATGTLGIRYIASFAPGATVGTSTPITVSASRTLVSIEDFGGQLYTIGTTATVKVATVGTGTPTTSGQAVTELPGLPTTTGTGVVPDFPIDAYLTHLDGAGAPAGINTMYIADDGTSFDNGSVSKWSFNGSTWTLTGQVNAAPTPATGAPTGGTPGFYWLAGSTASNTVTLFETYGQGGSAAATGISGALYSFQDTAGYGVAPSASAVTTLSTANSTASVGLEYHGVAFVPTQVVSTPTTTTLTDNGPNPSAVNQPVSFTVSVSGGAAISGETVSIEDADNGNAVVATPTLTSGTATFNVSSLAVGTHHLFAVYAGDGTHQGSQSAQSSQVVNNNLIVLSTQLTSSGIIVNFNQAINPAVLHLYNSGALTSPAVLTLTGAPAVQGNGGQVFGSLVVSNNNQTVYFVRTAGALAADTYTLNMVSSATGFETPTGALLSGTYQTSYTVASSTAPVVSLPDFARGPGQVDGVGYIYHNGLPLTISNGAGLTSAQVTLSYNAALFTPTGATTALAGYTIIGFSASNGTATFTISGGAALPAGSATLASIQYTIPTTAPYFNKETLRLNVVVNGGAIAVVNDDAVHIASYVGDVDGNHSVNAQDASAALNETTGSPGFASYKDLDPKLIANGSDAYGTVTAQDASNILNATTGVFAPIPLGSGAPTNTGADPRLFFTTYNATPGQTITVALNMQVTEPGGIDFQSADLSFTYDSSILTASNVRVGSLDSGYLISSNTSVPGQVRVGLATTHNNLANGTTGTIVLIDFTVNANATPGQSSPLNLVTQLGGPPTEVNGDPSTVNPYPTDGPNDANVDGSVTITGPQAHLFFPANTAASAGQQIVIPVNLTAITPFDYQSTDLNVTYDASRLSFVSDTTGTLTNGWLISTNGSVPGQIRIGLATTHENLTAGQTGSIVLLTFNVSGSASGSAFLDVTTQLGGPPTEVDGGAVTLVPAPTAATNDANVDGVVSIVLQPNQPPFEKLPATLPPVLFNPAAVAGLQTATPNTEAFSGANVITVTDSDARTGIETTTLTLTGSGPGSGGAASVGTLIVTASGAATVSGNGTAGSPLVINGNLTDLNATLASLVYTPGAGFYGTATLTVSTNDNGNSGFGGALTDTRSTSVQVVGLFISEVDLNRVTTGNPANSGQYLEVFSTIPNYTIPTGVYVVGVNGDKLSTGPAPGVVQDIFNLGGFTTSASNGYLAFLEKPTSGTNPYLNSGAVTGDTVFVNTGTAVGFGNGGTTSKFNGVNGVHTGATRTGRTGENATDLELGSVSYLLIETATAPTTATNIDAANTGTPNGATYASWNVLDGVGILRNTNGTGGPDRSYAPITFKSTSNTTGTTIGGSSVVATSTWTASYVGRIAKNTGESGADWLASVPTGSNGAYTLSSQSTQFAGQSLNNIGSPNYWAPEMTVVVNDGSSNQHSQVSELTITFNEPVEIANLQGDFVVKDAQGNVIATTVTVVAGTDNGDGTASGVTQLVITFNNDASADTFAFASPDPFGNTRGLVDGNFFLNTTVADITNNGVALDGAHNGIGGSTSAGSGTGEIDEFWRLFGDSNGDRFVDVDFAAFRGADHSTNNVDPNYLWYFDANQDGNIDVGNSTDLAAFLANYHKHLNP